MSWLVPFPLEYGEWLRTNFATKWPTPNELRRFRGFWKLWQGEQLVPMMSRYLFRLGFQGDLNAHLWFDIQLESLGHNVTAGDTGISDDGRIVTMHVESFPEPAHGFERAGMYWRFVYHRDGFADDVIGEVMYGPGEFPNDVPYNWAWRAGEATPDRRTSTIVWRTSFVDGQDTDWTEPNPNLPWRFTPFGEFRPIPRNP